MKILPLATLALLAGCPGLAPSHDDGGETTVPNVDAGADDTDDAPDTDTDTDTDTDA